jgi:hypothetical protein
MAIACEHEPCQLAVKIRAARFLRSKNRAKITLTLNKARQHKKK